MIPACSPSLDSFLPCYVVMLGVYGMFFTLCDKFTLCHKWNGCKDILPEHYLRRMPLNTWMAAGFYFCLLAGIATNKPAYYVPFLMISLLIFVLVSIKTLTGRTVIEGIVIPSKIATLILIFNWLSVAWTFDRAVHCTDWLEGRAILDPYIILHALYKIRDFYMIFDL